MHDEILYQLSLSRVPGIGPVQAKLLLQQIPSAKQLFKTPARILEKIEGIGVVRSRALQSFNDFAWAERELKFMERYQIRPLFLVEEAYPALLKQCYDPPIILYYKGQTDFQHKKMVGIIGTRKCSAYGRKITEELIESLDLPDVVIVSGMALGIDAVAHRAALQQGVQTVGVLAHSLDTIYPSEHHELAKKMMYEGGGLLTEFPSATKADRHHFPTRNRIVAGLCHALIVVETSEKGGSMITAGLAFNYNREVFAYPGRITDRNARGCHVLIQQNKAMLIESGTDVLEAMGWTCNQAKQRTQASFDWNQLDAVEKQLLSILEHSGPLQVDALFQHLNLSPNQFAAKLLQLELKGFVLQTSGQRVELTT